jgi:hypothetical protein
VADGTNNNMAGTADKYYIGPPDNEYWVIHRGILYIEDNANMTVSGYGGGAALTNGVDVTVNRQGPDGAEILALNCQEPIHNNGEWGSLCYDISFTSPGAGNNILLLRWTFSRSGKPVILNGKHNDKLVMNVQDDLSSLVSHRFFVQGYSTRTLTGRE